MNIDQFVVKITRNTGRRADRLVQYLYDIQLAYAHISRSAIKQLSAELSLSEAFITGVIDFYAFLSTEPSGHYTVLFSDNITDQMSGSHTLFSALCDGLNVKPATLRDDGQVKVDLTSCTGMCDQGPALLVNGRAITRLGPNRIGQIIGLIETSRPLDQWPAEMFRVDDNIHRRDLLLSDRSRNGDALQVLLNQGSDTVLQQIELSGLRGRGGAGFKTGLKWRLCRQAEATQRYVICNADEGEPGTFKDRVLLNSYADRVIEGMTVCGRVIGATRGFLYLRGEYAFLRAALEQTIRARRKANLLGKSILGQTDFEFDIEIRMGAGAYICGEESALIESLEGKRGIPRNRPPFPVTQGYLNHPSLVNNVETFMAAALIATYGADWFRSIGTEHSSGSKLLSVSGDCDRAGIYEYPFGTPIWEILENCGANNVQAVQLSGAAGQTIPPEEFNHRIAFEDFSSGGAFMVINQQRDLLRMVDNFSRFFKHESCGFCTPCRVGNSLLVDLLVKLNSGYATPYDLDEMRRIGMLMRTSSHCGLGKTAANPILDTLEKFPEIYEQRLRRSDYEPAFNLDGALQEAREITGRDDPRAHIDYKR